MKDFFKHYIRIFAIILIFLLVASLLTCFWYAIEYFAFKSNQSFSAFALHILGYESAETHSIEWRLVFSILGIILIAVFSSIFTVSLFDSKKRLIIGDKVFFWFGDAKWDFSFYLFNTYKDIYNVKLSVFTGDGSVEDSQDYFIPYFAKGAYKRIPYKAHRGSVIFRLLEEGVKTNNNSNSISYFVSYVDSGNGQEYFACKNYKYNSDIQKSDIIPVKRPPQEIKSYKEYTNTLQSHRHLYLEDDKAEFEKLLNTDIIPIDLSRAIAIREYNLSISEKEFNTLSADILLTQSNDLEDFGMICLKKPLGGNWRSYHEYGFSLVFSLQAESAVSVTLELKGSDLYEKEVYDADSSLKQCSYSLRNKDKEYWNDVEEVCFTVFHKNNARISKIKLEISNLQLQVKSDNALTSMVNASDVI